MHSLWQCSYPCPVECIAARCACAAHPSNKNSCLFQTEADETALREQVPVVFSGEEGGGRYLDLHAHFHRFVNAKFGRQMDYTAFVAELPGTQDVPRALKLGQPYRCGMCFAANVLFIYVICGKVYCSWDGM